MADEIKNYSNIEIPYDDYLSRGNITTPEGSLESSNGNVEEEIKSGDSLNDLWIRNFIKSENFSPKKRGFYLDGKTGYAEFSNVFISGNIEALTGTIGGFTINATSLTATSGGNTTIVSSGATAFSAGPTGSPTITITQAGLVTASNVSITGGTVVTSVLSGTIAQANLNLADRGWTQTSAFSVTDADTIAWGAGTLTSADGTAYSIGAGNTGNMVTKTYIYLDIAVSTIAYQITTTATTAVGVGKVLIAIAQNGTTEATYKVLQGQGGENIDAANIVAGSITANEIAASTITAGKMSVTDLSAISANLGTITTGTLNAVTLSAVTGTLDTITLTSPTGHIKAGQLGWDNGTGFYLGYSASTPKFSIGNSAGNKLTWDGTALAITGTITGSTITGTTITGGTIQTAVSGERIVISTTAGNMMKVYDSTGTLSLTISDLGLTFPNLTTGWVFTDGDGSGGDPYRLVIKVGAIADSFAVSFDPTNGQVAIDNLNLIISGGKLQIPVGTNMY